MAFLTGLTSRAVSAATSLTSQHGPIRTAYETQTDLHRVNSVMETTSPTEVRMNFYTTNRPTEREIREFERQFIATLSPRVPTSEIMSTTSYEVMNNSYITVLFSRAGFASTNSEIRKIKSITAEKILKTMPCCLYGSRGIGLENADDFDIAISIEDPEILKFIHYLENKGALKINIKTYAESSPESGYYGLYRFQDANEERIDLLVLYLDEDIDTIRSTINDLRRIPPYFLTNKKQRVAMYNQGLLHRGWKEGVKGYRAANARSIGTRDSERWL